MAKVKCYTPEGEEREKEPVDARECVERLGFTMEPPCEEEIDISKFNKAKLIELAESKGVELNGTETKAELIEALNGSD